MLPEHPHNWTQTQVQRSCSTYVKDRLIPTRKQSAFIDEHPPLSETTAYTQRLKSVHLSHQRLPEGSEHLHSSKLQGRAMSVRECLLSGMPSIQNLPRKRNIRVQGLWDVPGLENNYYNDIMDWADTEMLGIAIGTTVILASQNGAYNPIDRRPARKRRNININDEILEDSKVTVLKLHPKHLVGGAGTDTGHVEIYDLFKHRQLRLTRVVIGNLSSMVWFGNVLISGGVNGQVQLYHSELPNPRGMRLSIGDKKFVCGMAISGYYLAAGGNDGQVKIWDLRNQAKELSILTGGRAAAKTLAWCPWKAGILAAGMGRKDGRVIIWDTDLQQVISETYTKSAVSTVLWNPTFKQLVSSHGLPQKNANGAPPVLPSCTTKRGWVHTWDNTKLTKPKTTIPAHEQRILKCCLNPNQDQLATLGADEHLQFWNLDSKEQVILRHSIDKVVLR